MNIWQRWGFSRAGWHTGARGEYWVLSQALLFAAFVLLPRRPGTRLAVDQIESLVSLRIVGALLMIMGGLIVFAAARALGNSLTPLPHPRDDAVLVDHGPFKLVRHPIYSGVVFVAFGLAAVWISWPHAVCAAILFVFFAAKARREEHWLAARFPAYAAYAARVRYRLLPGIY